MKNRKKWSFDLWTGAMIDLNEASNLERGTNLGYFAVGHKA
jgi:hypothetical protein